jgi:hypothetical protein
VANRRTCIASAAATLLAISIAQATRKTRRIGFLSRYSRGGMETFPREIQPELENLGWVDGRNIELLEPRTT